MLFVQSISLFIEKIVWMARIQERRDAVVKDMTAALFLFVAET
jgi:hypothetical protein